MSCHAELPETDRQRSIRSWETAKHVFATLQKQGLIPEYTNQIQIELYKNLVCRVNSSGEIIYGYGLRFYGMKSKLEKRLKV